MNQTLAGKLLRKLQDISSDLEIARANASSIEEQRVLFNARAYVLNATDQVLPLYTETKR